VVALGLVAWLSTAVVLARNDRAAAGTTGAPYRVYVTTGSSENELTLGNLGGGNPAVLSGLGEVTATALNSTATLGAATTYSDFPAGGAVRIFAVPADSLIGTIPNVAPAAYAMDPVNPNVAFSVDSGGAVNLLKLNSATSSPIANVNPGDVSFTATSIAVTPDGASVVVGGIVNSFGFVDLVSISTGAVTQWQGSLRDYQVMDLAIAPNGSAVYATATAQGLTPPTRLFRLPLPFNPKTAPSWAVPSASSPLDIAFARSLTVSRQGQTVYLAGLTAKGQSVVHPVAAATGAPGGEVGVPLNSQSNGNGGFNGGVTSIALSPDGGTLLAAGGRYISNPTFVSVTTLVYPIATANLALGSPSAPLGNNAPIGPRDLAVTPDQAPAANLSPASGTAGTPVTLDASSSNIAYGSITRYVWSFGDGSPLVATGGPTVSHVYGAAGNYNVTVTETDSAGTSVPPAPFVGGGVNGPGTTPYLNSSASARISAPVAMSPPGTPPPPPPTTVPLHHGGSTTTTTNKKTTTTTAKPSAFHPKLVLHPTVGSPGTIVTVTGTGFPPNKIVTVAWSTNTGSFQEKSDAHGNLAAHPFFILTPDILGRRTAGATTAGAPAAQADFLVVPGTAKPGGNSGDVLFRSEGP
jgi:hypothetical protein